MTSSSADQFTPTEIRDGEDAGLTAGAVRVPEPYGWPTCTVSGCNEPADPWGDHRRQAHPVNYYSPAHLASLGLRR